MRGRRGRIRCRLVAQALVEPMRLMTHNPQVALYSDTIVSLPPSLTKVGSMTSVVGNVT